ncbi:MAG TPA: hypothetical protein DCE41_01115 [Cytophagales bacterium]|nr:hypothetical protein [Cytophagales bacterium]HAA21052.1 hypothetical protein [Cytophagales bacterium]HAP60776.1 hypothetical protein [Cytophagales bacterium]
METKEIVQDELIRNQIREELQSISSTKGISKIVWELMLVLIGFIISGLLGVYITNQVQTNVIERQQSEEKRTIRRQGVTEISNLIFERKTRIELLASAFKRNAPIEEIMVRKAHYDAAFVSWNMELNSIQLKIREITNNETYSDIESFIRNKLVKRFGDLDMLLTLYYDRRMNGKNINYDSGEIRPMIEYCSKCGRAITNYLWTKTNYDQNQKLMIEARNLLEESCHEF